MSTLHEKLIHDETGQSLSEYAIILGLIAIVCIAGVMLVGSTIKTELWDLITGSYPDGGGGSG